MSLLQSQAFGVAAPFRNTRAFALTPVVNRGVNTAHVRESRSTQTCRSQAGTAQASTANGAQQFSPLLPLDDRYEANHAFSDYANWLIPGTLLVGRYPYVEPSRCRTYEKGEQQLKKILNAGVTTFISLQAEVPDQSKMRLAGLNGFMPYKSAAEVMKHSMVGPPPSDLMNGLRTPELDRYLPPRHKPANEAYIAYAARETLDFAHNPIEDLGVPTERQLDDIIEDLQKRISAGEVLYVHCWGGRGRVGLVGACFLAVTYNVSADEALERVQRAFDTRKDNERRSPETDEQHKMVKNFVAAHQARTTGTVHRE